MQKYDFGLLNNTPDNNYLINGNFEIWQRPTKPNTAGNLCADRWIARAVGSVGGTVSITNEKAVVPEFKGSHNIKLDIAGATSQAYIQQNIEDCRLLAGKTITISIECKFTVSATVYLTAGHLFGTGGSPTISGLYEGKVVPANTYTKVTWTLPLPDIGNNILGTDATDFTYICFNIGGLLGAPAAPTGTYRFTNAKVEVGKYPTPFTPRLKVVELALCQRYYETLGSFSNAEVDLAGYQVASGELAYSLSYKAIKRVAPTITKVGTWAVTNCTQPTIGGGMSACFLSVIALATGLAKVISSPANYITVDAEF